ncbi:ammonium transporter [Aurantimonas sp. C2-6-R+9]|uniref:ammonium transporter n=1 Tax=unclassified Aurantimonas TaxID=2638230 RepID=UPI002E18FDDD|nr:MULTISPECIES: ammonium transporter [unclassified Aurantimonas]MEC5289777.1 ammonium transporter [Aurantimonas sp. C2-3-R2]MEC5379744.1 ammonium transporter [Aurantimonas sp. C2-6-R+9]MEC5410784.1 ammonium transporter [Aurantimonas sp. C2-4-R8]
MNIKKLLFAGSLLAGLAATAAFAQDAAAPAADAAAAATEAVAPTVDKGDVAWMMTATLIVLFMLMPGLALFYGGLVRAKNMLSVLMQCTVISGVAIIVWVVWGYSFAFGGGTSPYWGGLGKLFLAGVTVDSTAATFTDGVALPEYLFIAFQMTFAMITPALIVGAFAERIKFSAVVLFTVLWLTFAYFPIAHMVWDGSGLIFNGVLSGGVGALDFAGGTVVHINAGIAALMGCLFAGKRTGLGKDMMAPHSMTLTMVGASILWVGWFGFNAGSNLESTAGAVLAMINTFTATAGALLTWCVIETMMRGKASMLGGASGIVAGLVAVTPACGTIGPVGAIVLGGLASAGCYFFVSVVKNKFQYDDSLDVFGIHGIGGIIGAVGTGIFTASSLGGVGLADGVSMGAQVWAQIVGVLVTLVWGGVVSAILFKIVDLVVDLRPTLEQEREGLDLVYHGEAAYHS